MRPKLRSGGRLALEAPRGTAPAGRVAVIFSRAMRYLLWILKLALFAFMLTFAVKNTEPVVVRYFLGAEWRAPLIFVLLFVFCVGAIMGLLGALGHLMRQRREIVLLKRDRAHREPLREPPPPDVAAP